MKLNIPEPLLKALAHASGQPIEGPDAQKNFEAALEVFIALGANSAANAKANEALTTTNAAAGKQIDALLAEIETQRVHNAELTDRLADLGERFTALEKSTSAVGERVGKLIADATGLPFHAESTLEEFEIAVGALVTKASGAPAPGEDEGTVAKLVRLLHQHAPKALIAHDPYTGPMLLAKSAFDQLPPHHRDAFAAANGTVTSDPAPAK